MFDNDQNWDDPQIIVNTFVISFSGNFTPPSILKSNSTLTANNILTIMHVSDFEELDAIKKLENSMCMIYFQFFVEGLRHYFL